LHTRTSELSEAKALETGGLTVVVVVMSSRQIVVVNCGDSRVILSTVDNSIVIRIMLSTLITEDNMI
jgi:serine/threonine protein phosphatase PrpC